MLRSIVLPAVFAAGLPALAFAAGSETDTPPQPSETTTQCSAGLVWDIATQSCMSPEQSTNDDNAMLQDARELAYAGRYADASAVLDQMQDQSDTMVLTYRGFVARKTGDFDTGLAFYKAALTADPDNLLVRSYMGQGFVEAGDLTLARAELTEIRTRGGRGSWPEYSLRTAIETGAGFSY